MKSKTTIVITRAICLMLATVLMLTIASCGSNGEVNSNPTASTESATNSDSDSPTATVSDSTKAGNSESSSSVQTSGTNSRGNATSSTAKPNTVSTTASKTTVSYGDEKDTLAKVPKNLSGQKIKMLIWWNSGGSDKAKADYFKEKTGITVTYETVSLKEYQTRLASMVMANNAPAIAAILADWYPQPITRNLMQSIDATGWDFKDDIYATAMMDQFSYKGKRYGIALKGSNMTTFMVMFWNKSIFRQKGLKTTPETLWKAGNWNWDTCLDLAKKTTNVAKGEYGLTLNYMNYWMLSAGQDFVLMDKNGMNNNIKNPKLLEAWNFAWDMVYTHKVQDTSFTNEAPFIAGKAAMYGAGSYMMQSARPTYIPQSMKDDWGVVPFPSPAGQDPVAACEGIVFGFPKRVTGDKLQAAAWYLRYFLDDRANEDASFYPKQECWDVMSWMWNQKIQSFNSLGVLTYGGEYKAASIQYQLIDKADSKAKLKSNLDSWYSVFDGNIKKILGEMD